jgi:type II secretory pathway pseudopilin PulG
MRYYLLTKYKKQSGISSIEVIASLTILATVISAAIALFSSASSSQAVSQMSIDMASLRTSIQKMYSGQAGYGVSGVNLNAGLIGAGQVPTSLTVVSGNLVNVYAGQVNAVSNGPGFSVTTTRIPLGVCVGLLTKTNGWTTAAVGANPPQAAPSTVTNAKTQCGTVDLVSVTLASSN